MKGKNFILTILMFLFVSILSMAVENSTTLSDGLSLIDPTYQEGLKEYNLNLENIDKMYNYIEKNIKQKGRAIFYSKLDQEKKELIVTDENNKIIYTEKLPEKLVEQIPYFETKQIYQLKNGKTLTYSEMNTEMLEKKVKMKSETLMKGHYYVVRRKYRPYCHRPQCARYDLSQPCRSGADCGNPRRRFDYHALA